MNLELAVGLFALAFVVGIYGSIIGAGGGFAMVAGLVLFFDLSGVEAVGTGVITIVFVQLAAAITYDKAGMVDRSTAKWVALGSVPVSFLSGAFLANRIPERAFNLAIGGLLFSLAVFVILRKEPQSQPAENEPPQKQRLVGLGSAMGILSGAFGVGAGLVTVPAIRWIQKLSTHRAAATTTVIGSASGLASSVGHSIAGNPKWSFIPLVVAGAILGGLIGSSSAGRLSQRTVNVLLAAGLVTSSVPLVIEAL